MSKKQLNTAQISSELRGASAFFRQPPIAQTAPIQQRTETPAIPVAQNPAQKIEQPLEQMSKKLSSEAVENLAFQLRKVMKNKVNTEVPIPWKARLDDLAHELGVGKYELLMYIIGLFLGEVEPPKAK